LWGRSKEGGRGSKVRGKRLMDEVRGKRLEGRKWEENGKR